MAATGADGWALDLDERAIAALDESADVEALIHDVGEQVADRARSLAPKDTGAGAASIHAEVVHEDGEAVAKVSWDEQHSYMLYSETGTEKMSPHPFLRPALDSTKI